MVVETDTDIGSMAYDTADWEFGGYSCRRGIVSAPDIRLDDGTVRYEFTFCPVFASSGQDSR